MHVLETDLTEETTPPVRHRARRIAAGVAAAAIVAAGGVTWLVTRDSGGHQAPGPALTTAGVVRRDMAEHTEEDGTLGYAHGYTVAGGGRGRLTWLPDAGDTIRRGHRVYGLDGHDVPLFYGSTPLWRPLKEGVSDGADVTELERNLDALGYGDGMTVDDSFTAATAAAVRDWQHDLGVTETGTVAPGDVVMQPGAIRVSEVKGTLGGPASGTLLTATGTERQVTVDLPVSDEELAHDGAKVTVELPGGRSTTGHISKVGTVATAPSDDSGDSGSNRPQTGQDTEDATIPVDITLDHPSAAGRLDGAPVTVGFISGTHKNVLAVPVQALMATAGGTYGVEVVDAAGARHVVPVELGIFADGMVEVSGDGLAPGTKVEVPKS